MDQKASLNVNIFLKQFKRYAVVLYTTIYDIVFPAAVIMDPLST